MTNPLQRLAIVLAASLAATNLAASPSSAASSASEGVSASVGSISTSIQGSSDSSSKTETAEGDYRVIDVAELADRPGQVRLRLQPLAGAGEGFLLQLPRTALDRSGVGVGQVVSARHRPFGIEFARGDTREAFFLALDDAWSRELQTRPVAL